MFLRTFTATTIIGIAALAPPANSQPGQVFCNTREMITDRLSAKFSEQIAARVLQSDQRVLEVWTSPETGSFTVLLTRPDGMSCVVATGSHFYMSEPKAKDLSG